jgi:hypothetical protein
MRSFGAVCLAAVCLCACHKAPTAAQGAVATGHKPAVSAPSAGPSGFPARKAGLWEQTMSRDGKANMAGKMRQCIDATTDAKMASFGRQMGKSACTRQEGSRGLDGGYHFTSSCSMGAMGTVVSTGTAAGDFSSAYKVRIESDITGSTFQAANGHHVTEMAATYLGPCPAGMVAGDIDVGGMKMNVNHMPDAGPLAGH